MVIKLLLIRTLYSNSKINKDKYLNDLKIVM